MSTSAFVLVKLKTHNLPLIDKESLTLKNQLSLIQGVENVFFVEPGDSYFDAIVRITTFSIESLYKIVLGNIAKYPNVLETTTMIVIDQ